MALSLTNATEKATDCRRHRLTDTRTPTNPRQNFQGITYQTTKFETHHKLKGSEENKIYVTQIWLVVLIVLGFNTTLTAKVISWRLVMQMCFQDFSHQYQYNFSCQSHRLLFSHASEEVRGKNIPERKVTSTGDQIHNHKVMNLTPSPLNHLGRAIQIWNLSQEEQKTFLEKEKILVTII